MAGATRVHVDAWVAPRGMGAAHGLVGGGKITGAVTQVHTASLRFICANLLVFLRVGLCPV